MHAWRLALLLVLTMVMALSGYAASAANDKPVCDATQRGHFWPPPANSGSQSLFAASRSGDLEICTRGLYRYHWQGLTVSYQELLRAAKLKAQNAQSKKTAEAEPLE